MVEQKSETTHADIAVLYAGLNRVDGALVELKKASMMNKSDKAELAVKEVRELLFKTISTIHLIKNDIERLKKND